MNMLNRLLAITLPAAALCGCATSPTSAPVLLTLPPAFSAPTSAEPAQVSALVAPLLAIRRVDIPEYMVARRVRFRTDASTLAEWPNTYWAERIEIGVSREFINALHQQLPGWTLCEATCGDQLPTLALQVALMPMDYLRSARKLQAHARIIVSSTGVSPKVLQTQELNFELPSVADTPQAQAQAIASLIQQVAAAATLTVRSVTP